MRLSASSLHSLPPETRAAWLSSLSTEELAALRYDWTFWARDEQIEPSGTNWTTWLILAGRGFGKTRTGAETVRAWAESGRYGRIALVAETAADARDVMIEGESGILATAPPWNRPVYNPSKRRLTWPNGAVATTYSGEEPGQLRGPQHDAAWADEVAKWQYAQEAWDQLQFGLRLGTRPIQIVTTTPRPIPIIRAMVRDPLCHVTHGRTMDNAANLAPTFMQKVVARYQGTRLGRQELDAEIIDDVAGALWTRAMIDAAMKPGFQQMARVVVAVDPSGADGKSEDGDSIGIVVVGKGLDGNAYVLADRTCKLSPDGWGRVAVNAYHEFKADRIVAEKNFGGAMVEHVIRTIDPRVSYKAVTASRGKVARAEPVAALYEQGKVFHPHSLPELEDQLCQFTGDGYVGEGSPDRADALVWAITELMLNRPTPTLQSSTFGGR